MEQYLFQLLEHSPHLSEICFKYISYEGLTHITASHCASLLQLIQTKVDPKPLGVLLLLCRACPNLRSFSLYSNGTILNGDGIIQTIAQYCPLIQHLSTERRSITNVGMDALATIHTLTCLELSPGFTSAAVQRVLESNPYIERMDLRGFFIDDALIRCIGRISGNLRSLRLFKHKSTALCFYMLLELFRACPLLQVFMLSQSVWNSTATLRALFEHCPNLAELGLYSGPLPGGTLVAGHVLHSYYPSLKRLWVTCEGATGGALRDIFTYCTNLQVVQLVSYAYVTDDSIRVLTRHCHMVDTLHLEDCKNVSIAGLLELAIHCTSLKHLRVSGMLVNDQVLLQVSLNCTSLSSLHLFRCKGRLITETGILAVVEACTGLTSISITGPTAQSLLSALILTHLIRRRITSTPCEALVRLRK